MAAPAAAQTIFVSDSFTVAGNTMLEAHAPNTGGAWTRQTGNNGMTINAAADNVRNVGAGDWSVYSNAANPTGNAAEVVIGVEVLFTNASNNNWVDLFGRASPTLQNAYQARLTAGGNVSLVRYNGGTPTTLATGVVTVALNSTITVILSLKNASKEIWINGVLAVSSADNTVSTFGITALGEDSNVAAQTQLDNYFAATFAPTAAPSLEIAVPARLAWRAAPATSHPRPSAQSTRLLPVAAANVPGARRRPSDPAAAARLQWQLAANGAAIKIGVGDDGIQRVTRSELTAAGLDAATDLQALRLYSGGNEVPIAVDGDAILFVGHPLDTPATRTRVYWLVPGAAGRRLVTAAAPGAGVTTRHGFTAVAERRERLFFLDFLRNADGDHFAGAIVPTDNGGPVKQSVRVRHIDRAGSTATVSVTLQGAPEIAHNVALSFNDRPLGTMSFDALARATAAFDVPVSQLMEGDNVVTLTASSADDVTAVVAISIAYPHTYDADDDRLAATVDGTAQTIINGFTSGDVVVLDVTDESAPLRIPSLTTNGRVVFTAAGLGPRTILATGTAALSHPSPIVRNEPSSLRDAAGADEVIVTHPSFAAALAPLVALRQSQGLSVAVVKTDDIYDEFNYGAKSAQAIRDFLYVAVHRWSKPARYVLLVGDASFDGRNDLGFGDFDFLPTKLVVADVIDTASDTWFTDFDADGASDIPIGRLPVRTLDDAKREINRIVAYEAAPPPAQKRIAFVSDADPALDFHGSALALEAAVPPGNDVVDIDAARAGLVAARQQLLAEFGRAFLIDYVGHGSVETWSSNAQLLRNSDAAALSAGGRPSIVVAMTCLNGYFHDVYTESLAEALLRGANGPVAVWASSSLTSPDAQLPVNDVFLRVLFGNDASARLGDVLAAAQRSASTPDLRKTFLLFGDPATKIR
jgi:hypothetical protein